MDTYPQDMEIDTGYILKKRKKNISESKKSQVWNTYIGENVGITFCLCCKYQKISQRNFHCGHVVSEHNGGDINIENLRPICSKCNLSMGSKNMNDFIKINKF